MKINNSFKILFLVNIFLVLHSINYSQSVTTSSDDIALATKSYPAGALITSSLQASQLQINTPMEKTNFVVRDIFRLQYGHYRDAIALIDESVKMNLFPPSVSMRVLTDFTGDAYRLILEVGYNSLAEYEKSLSSELNAMAWKDWYEKFKPHVISSSREILRWVR